jgi:hypothetical protein
LTTPISLNLPRIQQPDKNTISETVDTLEDQPPFYTGLELHVKRVLSKARSVPASVDEHGSTVLAESSKSSSLESNKVMKNIL